MPSPPSQLFLARVWKEARTGEKSAVRVQIRHILSGETRSFRRWQDAVRFVMAQLEEEKATDCGPLPPYEDETA